MLSIDKIKIDMYTAMKAGNQETVVALRTLLSKLKDYQINKRKELTEQECIGVIKTLVKQRKEAATMYQNAQRHKLAQKEKNEIKILDEYLPNIMSASQHSSLVKTIVEEINAKNSSDIGRAMSLIMQRGGNKVDGQIANKILKELLE